LRNLLPLKVKQAFIKLIKKWRKKGKTGKKFAEKHCVWGPLAMMLMCLSPETMNALISCHAPANNASGHHPINPFALWLLAFDMQISVCNEKSSKEGRHFNTHPFYGLTQTVIINCLFGIDNPLSYPLHCGPRSQLRSIKS